MQATARGLPQLRIGHIRADLVLKRPVIPWHERCRVQHGVLCEKGLDRVGMPIRMEEQATEALLLIAPILAIGLPVASLSDHGAVGGSADGSGHQRAGPAPRPVVWKCTPSLKGDGELRKGPRAPS